MNNYEEIGFAIKVFIREHFNSQKSASKFLGISAPLLSQIIQGKRKANRIIQKRLISKGFDETIFYKYLDAVNSSKLVDSNDIEYIIGQLKSIILNKETIIESLEMQLTNTLRELEWSKKEITMLRKILKDKVGILPRRFTDL